MSNSKVIYPTIWDSADANPAIMPLLRGLWSAMMKMAETQCRAQARRGYLPYV